MLKLISFSLLIALLVCFNLFFSSSQKGSQEINETIHVKEVEAPIEAAIPRNTTPIEYQNISEFKVPLKTIERFKVQDSKFGAQSPPSETEILKRKSMRIEKDLERKRALLERIKNEPDLFQEWVNKSRQKLKNEQNQLSKFEDIVLEYKNTGHLDFVSCQMYL